VEQSAVTEYKGTLAGQVLLLTAAEQAAAAQARSAEQAYPEQEQPLVQAAQAQAQDIRAQCCITLVAAAVQTLPAEQQVVQVAAVQVEPSQRTLHRVRITLAVVAAALGVVR
jgi:hypothetical protein